MLEEFHDLIVEKMKLETILAETCIKLNAYEEITEQNEENEFQQKAYIARMNIELFKMNENILSNEIVLEDTKKQKESEKQTRLNLELAVTQKQNEVKSKD